MQPQVAPKRGGLSFNLLFTMIKRNSRACMATCKEWTKKGSLEKNWDGVHLDDEEKEYLEIRRCRRLQQDRDRWKLTTWIGSTEKDGEEK